MLPICHSLAYIPVLSFKINYYKNTSTEQLNIKPYVQSDQHIKKQKY